jgi:peroxiredoxin
LKFAGLLAAAALMAANPLQPGDTASRSRYENEDIRSLQNLSRSAPEPEATPVVKGSLAPDFSYQTSDGEWSRLHDMLAQGAVLLVLGARDEHITAIEAEREKLLDLGVLPVAVLDANSRTVRASSRRLGVHYTIVADPRSVIAEQFNALAPKTSAALPCWFVIDRKGRVRALDRTGLPASGYAEIATKALALPLPGVSLPTHSR